tara:strand:+ start:4979 stop:6559 length:1581 start_codon:yes stop_codon:yes gene_type:complete
VNTQPIVLRQGVPIWREDITRRSHALALLLKAQPPGPVIPLFRRVGDLMVGLMAAQQVGRAVILPNDEAVSAVRLVMADNPGALVLCAPNETVYHEFAPLIVDIDSFDISEAAPEIDWRDDAAVILYTSGTTGRPVAHCHGRDFIQAAMAAWRDAIVPDAHPTTLVATVPGQHMFGLESAVLLPLGCPWVTVLEERPFYPTDIVRVLESVPNRRVLITTPLHLRALLEQKIALPEIYRIVTATAPLAPELAIAAEAACGAQVIEVFGSTETGMIATRKTARATSYTVRSDTIVTLNDAGTGALVNAPHFKWPVSLQDRLQLTPEGFQVLGRGQDMVKVAGKRASMSGLSAILSALPGVKDGVFTMGKEESPGSPARPVAVVVAPTLSAHDIQQALRQEIPSAFVPRRIIFTDQIPRTSLGKVQSQALMALIEKRSTMRFSVPADHPALPGHFPGNPIVPGVVTLDHVLDVINAQMPCTVLSVRFHSPLKGGDVCDVNVVQGPHQITATCLVGARKILTAKLVLEQP